jgi:AraC-like DNA-binding protein
MIFGEFAVWQIPPAPNDLMFDSASIMLKIIFFVQYRMEVIIIIVIWAAVIQGFLLGLLFIVSRKHRSFASRLLGYFLLTFVFAALSDLLPFSEIGNYSISGYFTLPEVKLLFPVLFIHFVLEKVGRSSFYRLFLRVNYSLAFLMISLTLINILLVLISGSTLLGLLGWSYLEPLFMGQQYYAFILTVVTLIIALKETLRYRNLVRNEFADFEMMKIRWLWQYIIVLAPIILLWGAELFRIARGGTGQSELTTLAYIFIAFFNYFVSYKAFTQQTLFDTSAVFPGTVEFKPVESNKSRVTVDPDNCEKIRNEMETKEFYLNQNLSLHDFAREIQISARIISACINQHFGINFNEWVNNYRVEKALANLKDPKSDHLSIEGIGTSSGFKSRSAMYEAFRRKLGKSPGHFR